MLSFALTCMEIELKFGEKLEKLSKGKNQQQNQLAKI
jgi:hypothetical protein